MSTHTDDTMKRFQSVSTFMSAKSFGGCGLIDDACEVAATIIASLRDGRRRFPASAFELREEAADELFKFRQIMTHGDVFNAFA